MDRMAIGARHTMIPLGDGPEPPGHGQRDLRGHPVFDHGGEEIGHVRDLLLDGENGQIRLLIIAADHTVDTVFRLFALPVDAISRLEPTRLFVGHLRERVLSAPLYDPNSPPPPEYWDGLFAYYGHEPFWTPG